MGAGPSGHVTKGTHNQRVSPRGDNGGAPKQSDHGNVRSSLDGVVFMCSAMHPWQRRVAYGSNCWQMIHFWIRTVQMEGASNLKSWQRGICFPWRGRGVHGCRRHVREINDPKASIALDELRVELNLEKKYERRLTPSEIFKELIGIWSQWKNEPRNREGRWGDTNMISDNGVECAGGSGPALQLPDGLTGRRMRGAASRWPVRKPAGGVTARNDRRIPRFEFRKIF